VLERGFALVGGHAAGSVAERLRERHPNRGTAATQAEECGIPQFGRVLHLSGIQRTKPAEGKGRCEGKRRPLSLTNYRKCVRVIREALHTDPHDLGHATRARKPLVSFYQGSPVKDSSRVARCIGVRDRYCPLPGIAIASDGGRLQGTPTFAAALEAVGSVRAAVRCAPDAAGRFPTVGLQVGL
jgi:hypothetical protein